MLKFDMGDSCFNYRSAAVIIHDDNVLLHKSEKDDFWTLPGGRVELFESSEDTIAREIFEELGVGAIARRLLWHAENFFEYSGKKYHEVSNYFLAEFLEDPTLVPERDFPGIEVDLDLIYRWVPISKLSEYVIKPRFLIEGIQRMPSSAEYVKVNELGT